MAWTIRTGPFAAVAAALANFDPSGRYRAEPRGERALAATVRKPLAAAFSSFEMPMRTWPSTKLGEPFAWNEMKSIGEQHLNFQKELCLDGVALCIRHFAQLVIREAGQVSLRDDVISLCIEPAGAT